MNVRQHVLPPTSLIPNSPLPLMHYRPKDPLSPNTFRDLCGQNGWQVQWIYRYGDTQRSHYHSAAHECMVVLSGTATIRFGVADTSLDLHENTYGLAREEGGLEIEARAGDIFILPAGTAHKTHKTRPKAEFELLTPGNGHGVSPDADLDAIELSGFTMAGAYPNGSSFWDSLKGDEDEAPEFSRVWSLRKPDMDPILGLSAEGIAGVWAPPRSSRVRSKL
ncbi:hypothetical protein LTR56_015926 [Elasticomyces elasticus]|nr:hypothetical protein LTR56_015926 [Elasticomyces elasticus]KAK3655317.1 hypothetical protein LTR22_010347 [Elasticomyces elasticus]KAK4918673.1 hypothetical protein LTR49_013598 [Elasticomyces elasticus]KAK5751965.1 hypothetical protein LTS12_017981 [Elasticomyces elasticus]